MERGRPPHRQWTRSVNTTRAEESRSHRGRRGARKAPLARPEHCIPRGGLTVRQLTVRGRRERRKRNRGEWRKRYEEVMNSDGWRSRRLLALHRASSKCEECGSEDRLHVHHLTYRNFGNELPEDLQVLCESCHVKKHQKPKRPKARKPARPKPSKMITSRQKAFAKPRALPTQAEVKEMMIQQTARWVAAPPRRSRKKMSHCVTSSGTMAQFSQNNQRRGQPR